MPSFVDGPTLRSLLRPSTNGRRTKTGDGGGGGGGGGIFKMFKLMPMLTSGCKMVALLGRQNRALLADHATTVTLFGHRRGRVSLAIHEDTRAPPGRHVLRLLRGVSMGAGVLPAAPEKEGGVPAGPDGELTYVRARVERVVGSKDSEAFYMINPSEGGVGGDGAGDGSAPELSIFLVRMK
uniref:Uncharacterized protein n=1 Tax=Oryza brachyantha TaxID=4533 RepID=J3MY90_ORYBR